MLGRDGMGRVDVPLQYVTYIALRSTVPLDRRCEMLASGQLTAPTTCPCRYRDDELLAVVHGVVWHLQPGGRTSKDCCAAALSQLLVPRHEVCVQVRQQHALQAQAALVQQPAAATTTTADTHRHQTSAHSNERTCSHVTIDHAHRQDAVTDRDRQWVRRHCRTGGTTRRLAAGPR
jgi:hypothetical protein